MDALPEFELLRPSTLSEALAARAVHPDARLLGGGTDLMVNIRRGIVAPPVLIDMTGVTELRTIKADTRALEIGASVTLSELAVHPDVIKHYPVVAQAAHAIAGPTHRSRYSRCSACVRGGWPGSAMNDWSRRSMSSTRPSMSPSP